MGAVAGWSQDAHVAHYVNDCAFHVYRCDTQGSEGLLRTTVEYTQNENDVHSFAMKQVFQYGESLDKSHTDYQNILPDSSPGQSVQVWVVSDVHPKNQIAQ